MSGLHMGNGMAIDQMDELEHSNPLNSMEPAGAEDQVSQIDRIEAEMAAEAAAAIAAPAAPAEVEVKRWHGAADKRVFGWQRMAVRDALRLQDDTFRCPECLGRVRLRRASPEKNLGDHAEHYSKNTGCSLGNCFGGEKQLHAKPLN